MSTSSFLPLVIPSILGIAGGVVSAWVTYMLRRNQSAVETKLLQKQIEKMDAETKKIQLETESIRNETLKDVAATVSFRSADASEQVIYDSRQGFDGFDYEADPFGGADGELTREKDGDVPNGILNLERSTVEGIYRVVFKSYRIGRDLASYIPPPGPGAVRRIKAQFEARVFGSEHTILLVLKDPDSKPGHHLADWRRRLVPDSWTSIEAFFEYAAESRSRFRIDDQGTTSAPTTLQIRNLVLISKDR